MNKYSVTVSIPDNIILVEGIGLQFVFTVPPTIPRDMRTLWYANGAGEMEYFDKVANQNTTFTDKEYDDFVAPFVSLWEAEKGRRDREAADAEAARLAEYNSIEARAERLRAERDRRISVTDYLMTPDYPLTEEQRAAWSAYRQALRDITEQPGFPWLGGGTDDTECPWPEPPARPAKLAA